MSSSLESIGKYIFLGAFGFMAWTIGDATIRHLNGYSPYFIASVSTGFSVFLSLLLSSKIGGVKTAFTLPRLKLRILRGVILTIAGFLSYITFSRKSFIRFLDERIYFSTIMGDHNFRLHWCYYCS